MHAGQIMIEIAPPSKRASADSIANTIAKVSELAEIIPRVDFINIPEIISENYEGAPFYEKMDAREFGLLLKEATAKEIAINKVAVHLPFREFDAWLKETIGNYGFRYLIFVGGNSASIKYRGLSVTDANKLAAPLTQSIGNITIPERKDELQRALAKTQAGCSFFTTQILFEAEAIKKLLFEYDRECRQRKINPAVFFLCFAPVSDALDIEYIKWLGASIPSRVEARLKKEDPSQTSIALAQELYLEILRHVEENNLEVPISINVEPISLRNLHLTAPMVDLLNETKNTA